MRRNSDAICGTAFLPYIDLRLLAVSKPRRYPTEGFLWSNLKDIVLLLGEELHFELFMQMYVNVPNNFLTVLPDKSRSISREALILVPSKLSSFVHKYFRTRISARC